MVLHHGIRFRVVAQPCREPRKWRAHGREQAFAALQHFFRFGQ